ncbi:MAG: pseudouridine synthase [Bacteroidetes bacterium]|nr:pseudouridine synthase [Bacteroidota bacterium]
MAHYYIIYKPFQVLSQFTSEDGKQSLKDFFQVPRDVYPVGRLDYDSEGLLILTNDSQLNHRLLNPLFAHEREYWVQVDGDISQAAIDQLQCGVSITVDGKTYRTKPCSAKKLETPPNLPERIPPIRVRKNIPTSWISLVLREGKNRQVRKMTAKVGFPTLRLVRYRIAEITIEKILPGEMVRMEEADVYRKLFG